MFRLIILIMTLSSCAVLEPMPTECAVKPEVYANGDMGFMDMAARVSSKVAMDRWSVVCAKWIADGSAGKGGL